MEEMQQEEGGDAATTETTFTPLYTRYSVQQQALPAYLYFVEKRE